VIAEAIDTVLALGWALAAWIALTAAVAALALWAAAYLVWVTGRAVWQACAWLYAHESDSKPFRAIPEPREAHKPSGARTAPTWAQPDKDAA